MNRITAITATLIMVLGTLLVGSPAEAKTVHAERVAVKVHVKATKLAHHPRGDRSRFLCIVGKPCPPPCEIVQPCHTTR